MVNPHQKTTRLSKNKRDLSPGPPQNTRKVQGFDPDSTLGSKQLRNKALKLSLDEIAEMRSELESLPRPVPAERAAVLAVLNSREKMLRAKLPKVEQNAAPPNAQPPAQQVVPAGPQAQARQPEPAQQQEQERVRLEGVARQRKAEATAQRVEKEGELAALEAQLEARKRTDPRAVPELEAKRGDLLDELAELQSNEQKWGLEEAWVRESERTPTWDELGAYAEKIPDRKAGEQPHPMVVHLLQRLCEAKNRERPPVKVRRRRADGSIAEETVTGDNYLAVVEGAKNLRWEPLNTQGRAAMQEFTNQWQPRLTKRTGLDDAVDQKVAEWKGKVTFAKAGDNPNVDDYEPYIRGACEVLVKWIDPAIVANLKLPPIIIHGRDDRYYDKTTEGNYEPTDQVIHVSKTKFDSAALLLHEFGHHIEEQGPVENWCSFVLYLNHLAGGRNLISQMDAFGQEMGKQPYYGLSFDPAPKLPKPHYAPLYYKNALTELIPVALEYYEDTLDNLKTSVDWKNDNKSDYYPEYMAAVLPAINPAKAQAAGVQLRTLLSDPPAGAHA
jgi:hypothetical protein